MRVKAGDDYVGYVRSVLGSSADVEPRAFDGYDLRFFDDILDERLRGRLLDQIGCRLRRRAAALLNYRHGILA